MLKYITIGLLLIFTSTFCGCNLDTDDDDKLPGDKFWYGEKANAEAFMLSIYQHFRKATTDNGFFLYAGDIRCAPILDQNANNYLYLLQNDMRSYKDKKDGSNKGESSDFGAIYNWKNMYKVVQSANIMIQEIANIQGITDVERERYRAECRFMRSLAYFSWCGCSVMSLIIRRHFLPSRCRVQTSRWYSRIVWRIYSRYWTAIRKGTSCGGVTVTEVCAPTAGLCSH